jgi:hypothetical protein
VCGHAAVPRNGRRGSNNRNRRNFQNQRQGTDQRREDRPQNQSRNGQKFAKTMRIRQVNTGQMKSLECFESIEKLEELARNGIDFSKEEFNFNEHFTKDAAQLLRDVGVKSCVCDEVNDARHTPSSRVFDVISR